MTNAMKQALESVVKPLLRRPKRLQIAALCYRETGPRKEVLLITSRDRGRWILPKGWPIDGLDGPDAALQEAWEEAGVKLANIERDPVGQYDYDKRLEGGAPVAVETTVYPVEVTELSDSFPQADERNRKWVAPDKAAEMVEEPGLQALLRQL